MRARKGTINRTIPDALRAPSELAKASGRDFLTAMAIAYHVQCRLTESPAPVMRVGFDHTMPLAISIACGESYLLGMDEEQTAHAIALCASDGLSLGAARTGEHVSQWKGFAAPSGAFQAIHNVRPAQFGITGPLHVFEGPMGLRRVLGKLFGIDWSRAGYDGVLACSIKRYNAEFHSQSSSKRWLRSGIPGGSGLRIFGHRHRNSQSWLWNDRRREIRESGDGGNKGGRGPQPTITRDFFGTR